jgi:hypothetical protein
MKQLQHPLDGLQGKRLLPNNLESLERRQPGAQLFEETGGWLGRSVPPQIENKHSRRRIRCLRGLQFADGMVLQKLHALRRF